MREIPSDSNVAIVSGDFIGFDAEALFTYWTVPACVQEWWPEQATIDLSVGGNYSFEWPNLGWKLSGTYTSIVPGERLGFTWNWNHEPNTRPRQVDIHFQTVESGTRMAIFHKEFGQDAVEVADRQGIIEGWIHFGMKLAGLRDGSE